MQDAVSSFYHHLQAVASQYNISAIALPVEAVQHALWIPTLPFEAMEKWNTIRVNLVVITDRRPHSLSRLLQSTSRAQYLGDTVGLVINMEQSADRVTRMMVNSFGWRQGEKTVRHRILKGGLMPAIIESWYPQHDNDYAILLEDDIEVSPLFYVWTKYNILRYRYTNHPDAWRMFGISLYSPRNLELLPEGRRPFNPNSVIRPQFPTHTPYLSQVPCSWGAVYFPEHWREFHEYLTSRLEDMKEDGIGRLNITVPNSRSERWKKSWKKFIIQLVYLRGYVMLYPNFQQFESFSTNHLEFGTHIKKGRTKAALDGFTVPLMQRDTILSQLPSGELPNMDALPTLNLWGQRHTLQELEEIAIAWHPQVSACARTTERFNPQDLLCPFPGKSRKRKSPKKSSKPSKEVSVVQSIVIETVYVDPSNETTGPEVNGGADAETDEETEVWVPEPIDVAQLQTEEMEHALEDDQLHDLEADLAQLNSLQM
ncbi:uncharacterized protein BYT42DRAFT_495412 [Radiomyces spectabilis]|uniref:uncharacterized protein n=1 Tax=Radiomyces spectabilis TaxID=64574 RepID=UPI00221E93DA|nr:uncharacterized protein BYT42DRAFT_495412 [Radiomyces spectabilis]KAI8379297.1 hypothetical protein BYT42DRAFT_495412 [Radiomyces spectabilis]